MALCISLAFVVFYSVSGTKLPNYPMPCYSFVAILLGYLISLGVSGQTKVKQYPFWILLVINLAIPIAAYFGIKSEVETRGFENQTLLTAILTVAAAVSLYLHKRSGFKIAITVLFGFYILFNLVLLNYL